MSKSGVELTTPLTAHRRAFQLRKWTEVALGDTMQCEITVELKTILVCIIGLKQVLKAYHTR